MSHKKSRRARRAIQAKMERIAQMQPQRRQGFAGTLDDVNAYIKKASGGVPASAAYWGLGAVALGAAAVGAYVYRGRILEAYESTVDSLGLVEKKPKARKSRAVSARPKKKATSQSTTAAH